MNQYAYRSLDFAQILNVLHYADYCRLGMSNNDQPCVIPMYYRCRCCGNQLQFALASADSGEKITYLQNNPLVALEFELPTANSLQTVVVKGHVVSIKENCPCSQKVIIEIASDDVSGREYWRNGCSCGCE